MIASLSVKSDAVAVGVIGGTGLYDFAGLEGTEQLNLQTPYGATSGPITLGCLEGTRVAFLPRHGAQHQLLPSEIPQRANIWALASLGVRRLLSVCAVGSLRPPIEPRHLVIPDQLLDRTSAMRPSSFFGGGAVAHISFESPFCSTTSTLLAQSSRLAGGVVHEGGSMIVIEGPAFSTRAESLIHRSWGASVVGMTLLPEAKLAREAGMCYANLALVTDYDAWSERESVSVDLVLGNLQANAALAQDVLMDLLGRLPSESDCDCCSSLRHALLTPRAAISPELMTRLAPILARYESFESSLA